MKKWKMQSISLAIFLIVSGTPSSQAYENSYKTLSDLDYVTLFLGDILTIDAGWCWSSNKPSHSLAKKRLEIYKSGRWTSVGKVVFVKSNTCEKKTPYLQQFKWEVDELGLLNADGISGKLRLRNSAGKSTIYSQATVFESESAYQAKKQADEEAAKRAEAERVALLMRSFECLIRGGEWNSQDKYCVLPKN